MNCQGFPECFALGCGCENEPDAMADLCPTCGLPAPRRLRRPARGGRRRCGGNRRGAVSARRGRPVKPAAECVRCDRYAVALSADGRVCRNHQTPSESFIDDLVGDLVGAIAMLREPQCGSVQITDDQIKDRARNIAQALLGNYNITARKD